MKKLIGSILVFFTIVNLTFAQATVVNDAIITYNINIIDAKGEKLATSALNGAELKVTLRKEQSKTELKNKLGVEVTNFDAKAQKGFILKEYSGQKLMITLTADNWAQKNSAIEKLDFNEEAATVTIAGYSCKKATAVGKDGKKYVVWYDATNTIANKTYNNAFPQVKGLPVQYEMQSGNLTFQYTLTKFETAASIANTVFDAPKIGYRTMTFEESQQLKKGE
jgi:hypothetical protein